MWFNIFPILVLFFSSESEVAIFMCSVDDQQSFVNSYSWWKIKLKFAKDKNLFKNDLVCFPHGNDWLFLFSCELLTFHILLFFSDRFVKCGCYFNRFWLATKWLLLIFPKQWVIPFLGEWLLPSHVQTKIRKINNASAILLLSQIFCY